jgi:ComF family protein
VVLGDALRGLGQLFFPPVCLNCRRALDDHAALLCVPCKLELPPTDHHRYAENAVTDRLAGRLPLEFGAAAFVFRGGSVSQRLIHALKYHNRRDIGVLLGEGFGKRLREVPALADLDGIVPVPIHERRRHERGYNQAEAIAEGLGRALDRPVLADALRRSSFAGSQTKRGKLERLENVLSSFTPGSGDYGGQHLLLVDDVLTTGATLDFCGHVLLATHDRLRLSVATLAIAEL